MLANHQPSFLTEAEAVIAEWHQMHAPRGLSAERTRRIGFAYRAVSSRIVGLQNQPAPTIPGMDVRRTLIVVWTIAMDVAEAFSAFDPRIAYL